MITLEMLDAQGALQPLAPEVKAAIVELSKNDENQVIAAKFREHYNTLDEKFVAATGVPRQGDEKTYDYVVRVGKELAAAAKNGVAKAEYDKAIRERDEALAKGNDPDGWKRKYDDAKRRAEQLEQDSIRKDTEHARALHTVKVEQAIDAAIKGRSVRTDVEQALVTLAMKTGRANIMGANPEFADDGQGGTILQFRDANGDIMLNPNNYQKPYTLDEMITKELAPYNILVKAAPAQQGTGTQPPATTPPAPNTPAAVVVDLASATTQVQAMAAIEQTLKTQGLRPGSQEWMVAEQKAFADNNVVNLPVGDGIVK